MLTQIFDKTIGLLQRALDIRGERHRIISANIANQDTPGYKATEVRFKEALNVSLGAPGLPLSNTHPAHMTSPEASPSSARVPSSKSSASARLDGNNVNAEQEMAKLAENTLMYDATIQMIANKFRALKNAVREGR